MSRPASRFISKLTTFQIGRLESLRDDGETSRIRHRSHAILLSSEGTAIADLVKIFGTSRCTICKWLNRWEAEVLLGLADKPRPGAPPKLTEMEQQQALEWLRETPQSVDRVLVRITEEIGKTIGSDTLKRIAKTSGWSWKRMRKSFRNGPDPGDRAYPDGAYPDDLLAIANPQNTSRAVSPSPVSRPRATVWQIVDATKRSNEQFLADFFEKIRDPLS